MTLRLNIQLRRNYKPTKTKEISIILYYHLPYDIYCYVDESRLVNIPRFEKCIGFIDGLYEREQR
jgi:hypothetical protein